MDPAPDSDWMRRLADALKGHDQVDRLICGHVHRPFTGHFAGRTVCVSPATDIQLTLDLTHVDKNVPDGREILVEEPPGFSLHAWDGGEIVTHFCVAGRYSSAVTYEFPLD